MKKGKRLLALSLALVMCTTCFTACGGGDSEEATATRQPTQATLPPDTVIQKPEQFENNADAKKVELKVWAPIEEQKILKDLCTIFDGNHPEYDITFTLEECAEPDAQKTVSTDIEKAADVFYFANDQLTTLKEGGYLLELSPQIKERVEANLDPAAVASCVIDDTLYSVPFTANLWFMFYNTSMFTEDEVKDLNKIIEKKIDGVNYNISIPINDGWYIGGFFLGGGCSLFGENGDNPTECDWNSDRGVAIVNYLNSLQNTEKLYKGDVTSIGMLGKGELAAFCTGSWNALDIKKELGDNYGAVKLPSFTYDYNGEKVTADITPFGDYKSIGVKSNTKYPAEAALLAEFLAGDYAQEVRLKARSISPTFKTIMDMADKYNDPAVTAGVAQTNTVFPRPTISQIANYWTPAATIGTCVQSKATQVTSGDEETRKFLDTIVGAITAQK